MRARQRARKLGKIPTRNDNLKAPPVRTVPVWSHWLDRFLALSVLRWHRLGKHVPSDGHRGRAKRNAWMAEDLFYLCGVKRTATQVGSHLQMQRRRWVRDNGITWEEHILSKYAGVSDLDLSNCGAEVDNDEEIPSLVDDSGESTMCCSPCPATPRTMDYERPTPQSAQANSVDMDVLAGRLASLAISRPRVVLHDRVAPAVPSVGIAPQPVAHTPVFAPELYVFDPMPAPVLNLRAPVVNMHVPAQPYLGTAHVGRRR